MFFSFFSLVLSSFFADLLDTLADSIIKGGKSKTETRSSKLSVQKKHTKTAGRGKLASKDPNKSSSFSCPKEDEESDKSVSEINDEDAVEDGVVLRSMVK